MTSEERYREVVENRLGFVFTCSMEGRLTSLNASTAETLGLSAGALAGCARCRVNELGRSRGLSATA